MPQASEAARAEWNGPSDETAIKFLESAGYVLDQSYCWVRPGPDHEPTEREISAVSFLIDEWDFGGIAT